MDYDDRLDCLTACTTCWWAKCCCASGMGERLGAGKKTKTPQNPARQVSASLGGVYGTAPTVLFIMLIIDLACFAILKKAAHTKAYPQAYHLFFDGFDGNTLLG